MIRVRHLSFFFLVIFVAGILSCKKEIFREQEPNDSFDHANLIEVDRVMQGSLSTATDSDCFMVNIAEAGTFEVELSAVKGVNTAIRIYRADSPSNTLLKVIDDNRKSSPESFKNIWFDRGRYYIVIGHGDRDVPKGEPDALYQLKVSLNTQSSREEHEPNDTFEQATPIVPGEEYKGYYSPAFNKLKNDQHEEDFFSIDIDASQEKPLVADITLSGVPNVTGAVALYDPDRNLIAQSESALPGGECAIKGRGLVKAGRYYIDVFSPEYDVNTDKSYHLMISLRDYDRSSELEPNDSIDTANLYVDQPVKGTIFPANDRDYYRVQVSEPVLLTADVSFADGVDGMIRLFDQSGKKIAESDSFKDGKSERIPGWYAKSDIFVEVSARTKKQEESTYQLEVTKVPYEDGFEMEPNNDKDSATKISGKVIKGYLTYRKDRDFFLLDYGKRVSKKFTVTGIENGSFTVSLTDPLGYIIRSERVTKKSGVVFRDMIDGKAYIIVDAEHENPFEPYTITIGD